MQFPDANALWTLGLLMGAPFPTLLTAAGIWKLHRMTEE